MKRFILGTDWWTDCDDLVALRMLLRAHRRGEIVLEGIVINGCIPDSVRSVDGFMALEGDFSDIPLGIDLEATDFGGRPPYQHRLAPFAKRYSSNEDAEDGVRLYRRILAAADEPIEIIEIGYLQVFTALLHSEGDDISPLSGAQLVRAKVSRVFVMAGKWDGDGERENNFCRNARSRVAGEIFCRECPVPIIFLGWEIGIDVLTGGELPHTDHLWQALNDHGSGGGRCSWDPMTVHIALLGDPEAAGYRCVRGRASVDAEDGANHFEVSDDGPHVYVVRTKEISYYSNAINELIK